MARLFISKITGSLATIFGASLIAFVLLRVLPGDPARLIAGPLASEQALEGIVQRLGLNQPLYVQYGNYMSGFFQGDWGFSFTAGAPVRDVLGSRIPASAELALYAFLFAFSAALILALLATYRQQPFIDGSVRVISSIGLGTPPFWFAILMLIIFFEALDWLPGPTGRLSIGATPPPPVTHFYTIDALLAGDLNTFWDALRHLILPAVSLGIISFGFLVRLLRANLLEFSHEPFMIVVQSKGVSRWKAHLRHAAPNAFLPTLTASGLILAELLTGSVLIEKIFTWPGVGSVVVDSILRQDYAVVQAFILLSALVYVTASVIIDILYGVIDPRTRHAQETA